MKNATAELTRWAEEQTAITEREAHRLKIRQAIIDKLATNADATLTCKDGRIIYIDKFTYDDGYRVSDFQVTNNIWDSDYQELVPVRQLASQKDLATAEEVADYIAEIV